MKLWPFRGGLPLFAKELHEQAARARTYIIRVAYAVAFFLAAYVMFYDVVATRWSNPFEVLGQGRAIFRDLVRLQFGAVMLFMPALCCGVITREKERNTLGVLLLTKLGPRTIILEKFLSRLVPMITFLLLSLPLMAFCYTLGGITQFEFWGSMWALALTGVQVGAVGVMWSAYCRSTVAAFICSYAFGAAALTCCVPCTPLFLIGNIDLADASAVIGMTITAPFLTVLFLMMAEFFLIERAFAQPYNFTLQLFRKIDRFFGDLNYVTGGVVLLKEEIGLPVDEPIAWRETKKRSLGKVVYLFRVLILIETPVLFLLVFVAGASSSAQRAVTSGLLLTAWIAAALLVCVKGATVFAGERSSQTLDVLLATPIDGKSLMRQKCSGLRRLIGVLFIPFLTIYLFEVYWDYSLSRFGLTHGALYLGASVVSYIIFIQLMADTATWIGLKSRTEGRAIIAALGAVFAAMFIPLLIPGVRWEHLSIGPWGVFFGNSGRELSQPAMVLSPYGVVASLQAHPLDTALTTGLHSAVVALNIAVYAGCALLFRWRLLNNSDRLLRR